MIITTNEAPRREKIDVPEGEISPADKHFVEPEPSVERMNANEPTIDDAQVDKIEYIVGAKKDLNKKNVKRNVLLRHNGRDNMKEFTKKGV